MKLLNKILKYKNIEYKYNKINIKIYSIYFYISINIEVTKSDQYF